MKKNECHHPRSPGVDLGVIPNPAGELGRHVLLRVGVIVAGGDRCTDRDNKKI